MAKPGEQHVGEMSEQTYWNGEPTPCRRVVVRVGSDVVDTWWCAPLAGKERDAVEITCGGRVFFIDDEAREDHGWDEGHGWAKVTTGEGSPIYGHGSLPDDSLVLRDRLVEAP